MVLSIRESGAGSTKTYHGVHWYTPAAMTREPFQPVEADTIHTRGLEAHRLRDIQCPQTPHRGGLHA